MSASHVFGSHVRQMAEEVAGQWSHPRDGIVSSYDPNAYAVKVRIQPEDRETGWLPLGSSWVGNGWGLFSPPPIGAQVTVIFQEGNPEAGKVAFGVFSDTDRPLPVPAGEAWLVHQSGSFIKLLNDGSVHSKGPWVHDGTFSATGEVTALQAGAAVGLGQLRDGHNIHKHPGVAPGSGVSGTNDHPV